MQLEKEIMQWRNIEPLCGYLSFSWRVFLQIVGISTKSSHIKNCLRYNPTSELEQPRRWRREKKLKNAADFITCLSTIK